MSITLIIVIGTAIFSYLGFTRSDLLYKYMLNPYQVVHRKQYYRVLSHGFLHADWGHLAFNMLALYSFGMQIEFDFKSLFGPSKGPINFLLLYFCGMIFSSIYSIAKHKDNHSYNALGASGAVSAVVFASILLRPEGKIYLMFFPFGINSVIFGVVYLILSYYMAKRGRDNIGHDAHFWGSVFGFIFPIIMKPELFSRFINIVQELLK
ncbi:MAG: rhomboid family intramembrane serine protease [Bacteroidetes bacterium]|nr:rhomboid family intramembrane serine protease [Bacteroidota bacterium]